MSSAPTPMQIAGDATWLAQALDPSAGVVRLVAMNRDSYRAASFLDDRLLQKPANAQIVPWPVVQAAAAQELRADARWIFHIGHVGSTLVSRLLGELPGVLAIREPRTLRDLAMSPPAVRAPYMGAMPKLFSRTFADDETACVKATSLVSEIAAELTPPGALALFMFATPVNYIASILAGPNSVKEVRALDHIRRSRMAPRVTGLVADFVSDAHLAAAAWACEMTSLEAAAEKAVPESIAWADFDRMLAALPVELRRAADHFAFVATDEQIATIASGPLTSRYSKDLEYDYSASLRRELIDEARSDHRRDIDSALAMLHAAAKESPLLARALDRSGG